MRQIVLRPEKKFEYLGRHPWILASSVVEPDSTPGIGEVVDLVRSDGVWVARGLYNPHSRIRVRTYVWEQDQTVDTGLILARLDRAIELRDRMGLRGPGTAERLVFSEADQLSGLIVDRFGEHIVIQLTAAALYPMVDAIADHLFQRFKPLSLSLQIDKRTGMSEGIQAESRFLMGHAPEASISVVENGLEWQIDLLGGQKTGYYLDQRDNRLAAARWTPENARVLDICTYIGGFALTIAAHASTREIIAVDSSAKALESARLHADHNGLADRVVWEQSDFFEALSNRVDAREQFDMIVLDPPKLAGSRDQLRRALAAYHRLNYLAVRLLTPGGILVTCSCSGRVTRSDFRDMLLGVSNRTRRELQILENRGAAADHPVSISCPETDYLKCFIVRVQ